MSFVADFIGGAVDAVGGIVDAVASTVGNVLNDPLKAAAAIALAIATSGASLGADAAAFAAASETAAAIETYSTFEAVGAAAELSAVSSAAAVTADTWSFFQPTASGNILGQFNAGAASAVGTSVADYAAAAAAGEATGAATAFNALTLTSGAALPTAGFLETALNVAKGVKNAVDTVQIVNNATRQKSIVPRNAPVPAGWAVDARWSPNLGDNQKFQYDPASGALVLQSENKPAEAAAVVPAATPALPAALAWLGLGAAVLYLVR